MSKGKQCSLNVANFPYLIFDNWPYLVCNVKFTHNALITGHIYKPNRPLVHDISHFIAKIKPKMTEFQYFIKTSVKNGEIIEARQLYFDYHLWYLIRPNYWVCTNVVHTFKSTAINFKIRISSREKKNGIKNAVKRPFCFLPFFFNFYQINKK